MNFRKYYTNSESEILLSQDRKIIRKRNRDKKLSAGLVTEVSVLAILSHPNIIKMKGVVKESNEYYIELPFIEQTLQTLIFGSNIIYNKKSIAFQLLLALDYLAKNVIGHFDLKPHNILIQKELILHPPFVKENVILFDFDIAEVIVPSTGREKITTKYRPIENLIDSNLSYTFQSEIWSYGMILYEMYRGKYVSDFSGIHFIKDLKCKLERSDIRRQFLEKNLSTNDPNKIREYQDLRDLLFQIFQFDRDSRPTASELLKHRFFDSVRGEWKEEISTKLEEQPVSTQQKSIEYTKFITTMKQFLVNFSEREQEIILNIFEQYCSIKIPSVFQVSWKQHQIIPKDLETVFLACTDLGMLLLGYTPIQNTTKLQEQIWEELGYRLYFPPRRTI